MGRGTACPPILPPLPPPPPHPSPARSFSLLPSLGLRHEEASTGSLLYQ